MQDRDARPHLPSEVPPASEKRKQLCPFALQQPDKRHIVSTPLAVSPATVRSVQSRAPLARNSPVLRRWRLTLRDWFARRAVNERCAAGVSQLPYLPTRTRSGQRLPMPEDSRGKSATRDETPPALLYCVSPPRARCPEVSTVAGPMGIS